MPGIGKNSYPKKSKPGKSGGKGKGKKLPPWLKPKK